MPRRKKRIEYDIDENSDRLEGVTAIRKYIDPHMSSRSFYERWRPLINPILFEYRKPYLRPNRYFTFKSLVIAVMLKERRI